MARPGENTVLLWVKAVLNVDFLEAVKRLTVSASRTGE